MKESENSKVFFDFDPHSFTDKEKNMFFGEQNALIFPMLPYRKKSLALKKLNLKRK